MGYEPAFGNRREEIAGFAVAELARRFGTPVYVYDAAVIRQRYADLAAFDVVRYAQKACSNLSILKLLREQGALVDAVSVNEVRRALLAGYTAEPEEKGGPFPIVYTADIFDQAALDFIADECPVHVNCGSMDMIWQLGERVAGQGREITLRLNPGFGHGHSQKTNTGGDQSKHGIWFEDLERCFELAVHFGLKITGLHMHIGSGTDLEHLRQVCGAMKQSAREVGTQLQTISCGGGLPVPYRPGESYVDLAEYHRLWQEVVDFLESAFGHKIRLEVEPGRYLVAESGSLITEIRAVKRQKGNLFYLVDAGFNNLARPIMYGSWHPIAMAAGDGRYLSGDDEEAIVGGPLCESGDIFTQEEGGFVSRRRLPRGEVGDLVVLGITGAYGAVMASNYNSKLLAPEVLLDHGQARVIRKRQSFEQLVANELETE
ncbi:MAG: diaminopimelate decarboxylase [Planctomycetia bacterium]|nr:diaminopimelate decarboxylase [Planctomycetia bacterium]